MNPVDEFLHLSAELIFIDKPVSESGSVIISFSEPPVVQYHHIHSEGLRLFCKRQNIRAVKIHIKSFPAVDKHRTDLIPPLSAADMPADALMQIVGKFCESLSRIAHDHFGRCKGLSGRKGIGELFLHQAELHSGLSDLVHACAAAEAAAVDKLHGIAAACGFSRISAGQDHHGIIMMGGHSSPASDPLLHVRHRRPLEISLQAVASVKRDQVILSAHKVQIRAHHFFQPKFILRSVADHCASRDDIEFRKNTVQKRYFRKTGCVLKYDLQSLCLVFLSIYSRQSFQAVFPVMDPVSGESQITSHGSVSVLNYKGRAPHIARSRYREFLRKQIQRICAVLSAVV